MAKQMDMRVRRRIRIQAIRLINDRGAERMGEVGARRGMVGIDGSIVLGNGIENGIETEIENGTRRGRGSETRDGRTSIARIGRDTTVVRGSIDGETTSGAVRPSSQTDLPLPSRMDVPRPHRKRRIRTGKKASKSSRLVMSRFFVLPHGSHFFFRFDKDITTPVAETALSNTFRT